MTIHGDERRTEGPATTDNSVARGSACLQVLTHFQENTRPVLQLAKVATGGPIQVRKLVSQSLLAKPGARRQLSALAALQLLPGEAQALQV